MEEQKVTLEEFAREAEDMLKTCFEGEVVRAETTLTLLLSSGEKFILQLKAA